MVIILNHLTRRSGLAATGDRVKCDLSGFLNLGRILCEFALIPQPLLPEREKGSQIGSPFPALGKEFRVEVTKVGCTLNLGFSKRMFEKSYCL